MTKLMTAHDLVNVYYVQPVFAEALKPIPAESADRVLTFWDTEPRTNTQVIERADSDREFQALLDDIGSLGNNPVGVETPNIDVAKKYERKVVSAVAVRKPRRKMTQEEKASEKQRVVKATGINPEHLEVVKYNPTASGWVVTDSKTYILLKQDDTRLLIHTSLLSDFLRQSGQKHTTLRMSKDGKKLTMPVTGHSYPFKQM